MAKEGEEEFKEIGETQDMDLDDLEEMDAAADTLPGTDGFEPIDDDAAPPPDTLEMELGTEPAADAVEPEPEQEPEEEKPKKTRFGKRPKTGVFKKTGKWKKKDKKKKDKDAEGEEEKPSKKTKSVTKFDRKKIKMKGAVEAAGGPKPFPVICIECYEEFHVDPNVEVKIINCPECDHPSQPPNEELLEKWAIYKRSERNKLIGAVVSFVFMALLGVIWVLLLANPNNAEKGALNTVFPAFMFVAFAIGIFFAIIYERSRHEAYF
ncbi:MAG: hypothetical protein ACYS8W_20170 [Planctomycetota bacterium]|jgi:hypothetical protein